MYGQAQNRGSQPAGFSQQQFSGSNQGPSAEQQVAQPVYKSFPGYGTPDQRKAAFASPYSQQSASQSRSQGLASLQNTPRFPSLPSPGNGRSGQSSFNQYSAGGGQDGQAVPNQTANQILGQEQVQRNSAQQGGWGVPNQREQQQNAEGLNGHQAKQVEAHPAMQQPRYGGGQSLSGQDVKAAGHSNGQFSNQQGPFLMGITGFQGSQARGQFGGLLSGGGAVESNANGSSAGQHQPQNQLGPQIVGQENKQQPGGQSAKHVWQQLANQSFDQFMAQQGQASSITSSTQPSQPANGAQQHQGGQHLQMNVPPWQDQQPGPSTSIGLTPPTLVRHSPGYSPKVGSSQGQARNFQAASTTADTQSSGQNAGETRAPLLSKAELEGLHKLLTVSGGQQAPAVPAVGQSAPSQGPATRAGGHSAPAQGQALDKNPYSGTQRGGAAQAFQQRREPLSQPAVGTAPEERTKVGQGPAVQQTAQQASIFNPYAMFQQVGAQQAPQSAHQQSRPTQQVERNPGQVVKNEVNLGPAGQNPPSWGQQNGLAKQEPASLGGMTPGTNGPQFNQRSNLPQGQGGQFQQPYKSASQTQPQVTNSQGQSQPASQPNQNQFQQTYPHQPQFNQAQLQQLQKTEIQQPQAKQSQFQPTNVNTVQFQQAPQNRTQLQQPAVINTPIQSQLLASNRSIQMNQSQPSYQMAAPMHSQRPQSSLGFPQQQFTHSSPAPFQPQQAPQTIANPVLNEPQFQQQMQGFAQQPQIVSSFHNRQNQNNPATARQQQRESAMAVLAQQELALQQRRAQQSTQSAVKQAPQTPLTPLQQLAALRKKQEEEQKQGVKPAQQQSLGTPPQQQALGQTQLFGQPQVASVAPQQQTFGNRLMGAPQVVGFTAPQQGQMCPPANSSDPLQAVPGQANLQTQSFGGQNQGVGFSLGAGFVQNPQIGGVSSGQSQPGGFGRNPVQRQGQGSGFGQTQGASLVQGMAPNVVGQGQGLGNNQGVNFAQRPILNQQLQPQPSGQVMANPPANPAFNQMPAGNQGQVQVQSGNMGLQPLNQSPKPGFANPPQQMRPQFPMGGGFGTSLPMSMVNSPRFAGQPKMPVVSPGVSGPRLGFQPSTATSPRPHFQQGARRPGGGQAKAVDRTPLRCEACDKDFVGREGYNAHLVSHEKCSEPGCTFEGSGKVLKEHRYTAHKPTNKLGKAKVATTNNQETDEEIRKWREERRKHYPTETNVQKKLEDAAARRARGELEDAEAQKRRQRLREVLQQQKALGCPVAEIPPHILREDGPGGSKRPLEATEMLEGGAKRQAVEGGRICHFFLRGRCRKGRRCNYLHQRRPRGERGPGGPGGDRRQQNVEAKRAPTLLEKLLAPEIRKDKSFLLQSFRFMVNNSFFLGWPKEPLKFFEWTPDEDQEEAPNEAGGEFEGGLEPMLNADEGESDYESAGDEEEVE